MCLILSAPTTFFFFLNCGVALRGGNCVNITAFPTLWLPRSFKFKKTYIKIKNVDGISNIWPEFNAKFENGSRRVLRSSIVVNWIFSSISPVRSTYFNYSVIGRCVRFFRKIFYKNGHCKNGNSVYLISLT